MHKMGFNVRTIRKATKKLTGFICSGFNYLINRVVLFFNQVSYGKKLKINGKIRIINDGTIKLGNKITVNSGKSYNPIGGDTQCVLHTFPNGEIKIGDAVGLSNCAIISADSIEIEDHVKIGGGVRIYDLDFHSLNKELRREFSTDISATKPILIKRDAFIGGGSIILKGVTIGEGSIIGAGSVVTKDIGPNEIWAGNPAVFIKKVN